MLDLSFTEGMQAFYSDVITSSIDRTAPLLACQPNQFQIQNPHLYLLVSRMSLKFKFKFNTAPLFLRQPDQFKIEIQSSDCASPPSPLIASNSNLHLS